MWSTAAVAPEDQLDRAAAKKVLRRSLALARPVRRDVLVSVALIAVSTVCTLAGPTLVRFAIDHGLTPPMDIRAVNVAVVAYVAVVIVGYFLGRAQQLTINRAGEGFLRDLRVRTFGHLLRQSMSFYDREKAGVLVSRLTSDIDSMSELVQFGLLQFVSATLLLVLTLALLFAMSVQLTLICLVVLPVIIAASIRFQRQSNRAYLHVRDRVGQNLSALQESITGVRVIQAYAREDEQIRRFESTNRALYDAHMSSVRVSVWYFGLVEWAGVAAAGAVVGVGGWLVHEGSVSVGTVAAFVLLLSSVFEPVAMLSQLFNSVQSSGAALQKLYDLLDAEPEIRDQPGAVDLPATGEIEVDRVSFGYAGERPAGTARRQPHDRARGAPGPRRSDRGRQVDAGQAHRPPLRPHRRGGALRRPRPARGRQWPRCGSASSSCPRRGSSSRGPSGPTCASPGPRPRTRRSMPHSPPSAPWTGSRPSRTASTPRCASAGHGSPPASASSCPSVGRRWSTPRCSCSTRPRPTSTLVPKRRSRPRWSG